ncbi:MAG: hypothetical protein ABI779_26605 [Acidobacteriota bacterium]
MNRRVSHDAFVEVETNRYPVPFAWCRAEVGVELSADRLREPLLRLRLVQSVERLRSLLEAAAKREFSYSDFLEELFGSNAWASRSS